MKEMDQDYIKFTLKAHDVLRSGMSRNILGPMYQILIKPSFENPVCFNIDKMTHIKHRKIEESRNVYEVNKCTWVKHEDFDDYNGYIKRVEFLKACVPTILKDTKTIESESFHDLLVGLKKIKVYTMPKLEKIILDGTSYELYIHDAHAIRFGWQENGPSNWKKTVAMTNNIIEILEKEFGKDG